MPPRKPPLPQPPPAVGPALKLIFEKGTLSGQTNQFSFGSTINLGRVARGNTISVKDAGISSKHLRIRVENSGSDQFWAVTDLGSSNGTILNETAIESSVPVRISDGDLLKIGEETTIRIGFAEIDGADERKANSSIGNGSNLTRRNAKRNVRNKRGEVKELGVIDECSDLELRLQNDDGEEKGKGAEEAVNNLGKDEVYNVGNTIAGRTRRKHDSNKRELTEGSTSTIEEDEAIIEETEANMEKKVGTRGRAVRKSKKSEDVKILTSDVGGTEEVEVSRGNNLVGRVTRSSKKSNDVKVSASEIDEGTDADGEIERGRLGRRATKKSEKANVISTNSTSENSVVGGVEMVSTRITRSSRKLENAAETGNDYPTVIEGKETRKVTRGRKKKVADLTIEEKEPILESGLNVELEKGAEISDEAEEIRVGKQGEAEVAGTSGVREDQANVRGNLISDLEKMTLGEWLDYLEVHLPKQIIDTTEEMIAEMRRKAEGLHKFRLQHKNEEKGGDV